jgi:rare lipoprotein A
MRRYWLPVLSTLMLAGCNGGDDAPRQQQDNSAIKTAQLDRSTLERLRAAYPRLNSEPLPAPRPTGTALETRHGDATFYANTFEGRRTASGIPFRQNQMVAAHRAYPFGTILRVTNLQNDRSVNVRVVDRGPYGNSAAARRTVIDLSRRAAETLGYIATGRTRVRVEVLEWGSGIAQRTQRLDG